MVIGPTASGKTKLAVQIAHQVDGEIISIDSRQVYQRLNIGTGKDLYEYTIQGKQIPYHLIDIIGPEKRFHIVDFITAFNQTFESIIARKKTPILCGGSLQYIDVLLNQNELIAVPVNDDLRKALREKPKDVLIKQLESYVDQSNYSFDFSSTKRIIRAIEIMEWLSINKLPKINFIDLKPLVVAPKTTLEERKQKISKRLLDRLENGLIEEAQALLDTGITHEQLRYFGLEYKFLSLYLNHEINRDELFKQLETAIHQYAKRQMTWIRKIETTIPEIQWINQLSELDLSAFKD